MDAYDSYKLASDTDGTTTSKDDVSLTITFPDRLSDRVHQSFRVILDNSEFEVSEQDEGFTWLIVTGLYTYEHDERDEADSDLAWDCLRETIYYELQDVFSEIEIERNEE